MYYLVIQQIHTHTRTDTHTHTRTDTHTRIHTHTHTHTHTHVITHVHHVYHLSQIAQRSHNSCLSSVSHITAVSCQYHIISVISQLTSMGWLRLVSSLKLQVSFAEHRLFYRALLQKRPVILRSLLVVAAPYVYRVYHVIIHVRHMYRVSQIAQRSHNSWLWGGYD